MDKVIKDNIITETFVATDLLSGATVGTWQEDYPLRQVEFEWIKNSTPKTFTWANNILLTTIGFGLNLLAKWYSYVTANTVPISKGVWIAFLCGFAASVVPYFIGFVLPNKRKKVMKKIEEHFKNAPTTRQAYREQK
jgi:hypothetical protein